MTKMNRIVSPDAEDQPLIAGQAPLCPTSEPCSNLGLVDTSVLKTLQVIATAAGQTLLEVYGTSLTVDYKGPGDPVTAADHQSNRLIVQRLNQAFPDVPVVAEESEPVSFKGFQEAERVFFVDPLDGTREFLQRNGEFAVMIGLVEGCRAVAAVIYAPATGVTWIGAEGLGAWRIDPSVGRWIPVCVSGTDDLSRARIVVSRSHRSTRLERALTVLGAREVRPMGSAGLKGAQVAEGLAELYVDTSASTKRWDACAVDALVTAAGGRVSDLTGARIDYRGPTLANEHGLVVSNGRTHEAALAKLARQL
jgi:3'(2'), 5'-bisphosphate nucleotidase